MKILLVLRHAKSSWDSPDLADHDRPLNKRGRRDAPRIGQLLSDLDLVPDWIGSSTAKRARETVNLVVENCGYENAIYFSRDLFHADVETFLDFLRTVPDDPVTVLLVGHNPGLEELVDWLTDESIRLPTAALAQIELPIDSWKAFDDETEGTLKATWRPKELG